MSVKPTIMLLYTVSPRQASIYWVFWGATAWVLHPISLLPHSLLLQVVAQYWAVQWWAGVLRRRKRSSQTNWRQCLIGARRVIWPTWLPWLRRRTSMKLVKMWVYRTKIHVHTASLRMRLPRIEFFANTYYLNVRRKSKRGSGLIVLWYISFYQKQTKV